MGAANVQDGRTSGDPNPTVIINGCVLVKKITGAIRFSKKLKVTQFALNSDNIYIYIFHSL